jgi:cytochrome P450
MSSLTEIPAYVSKEAVFDFDIYADKRFGADPHSSLEVLHREAPDVFYTPRNGGHWIITRQAQITEVVQDPEHFSVREMQVPRVPNPPVFIPLSLDPPENLPFRQALMPKFSPKAVKELEDKIRYWASTLIDQVANKGECDFVHDVTEPFPVSVFMELMGMDLSRLREFRQLNDTFFNNQNNVAVLEQSAAQIIAIMTGYIEQKQQQPDDSLITHITRANINGRPITLPEMQNMCLMLFTAGLHTVANLTGFAFWHLATDAELQKRLVANPELAADFAEESLRLFGVVNVPRLVRKDCEKFGVNFREGDMIVCMLPLAGRDDRVNDDPGKFDLDRKSRDHVTFSKGQHLCAGHFLARAEIRILTEEWLKRVPSFALKPGSRQHYHTSTTFGLTSLPLQWPVNG